MNRQETAKLVAVIRSACPAQGGKLTNQQQLEMLDAYHALPLCESLDKALRCMLESEDDKETPREFIEKTCGQLKKMDAKKLTRLTNPFIPTPYRPKDWIQLRDTLALMLEQRAEEMG